VEGENQPLTGIVMRLLDDVLPVSYLKCCHRNDASSLLVTPLHRTLGVAMASRSVHGAPPPDFDQAAGGSDLRFRATTGIVRPAFAW